MTRMAWSYHGAELLAALWRIAGPSARMPGTGGRLDRALHACRASLPSPLSRIGFSAGALGLRCLELPDLIMAGEELLLLAAVSPAFEEYEVKLSMAGAEAIVLQNGLEIDAAVDLGLRLRANAV